MNKQRKHYTAPAVAVVTMQPLCLMTNFSKTDGSDKTGGNTDVPGTGDFTRRRRSTLWEDE